MLEGSFAYIFGPSFSPVINGIKRPSKSHRNTREIANLEAWGISSVWRGSSRAYMPSAIDQKPKSRLEFGYFTGSVVGC